MPYKQILVYISVTQNSWFLTAITILAIFYSHINDILNLKLMWLEWIDVILLSSTFDKKLINYKNRFLGQTTDAIECWMYAPTANKIWFFYKIHKKGCCCLCHSGTELLDLRQWGGRLLFLMSSVWEEVRLLLRGWQHHS